jgi:hypothetical protein
MAIIYGGGTTTAGGGTGGAFQDATTSVKGITRFATLAETQNGLSQSIATTPAGVKQVLNDLIGGAPEILDTLKEIADAIGNDPNFATRLATAEQDIQDIAQSVGLLQQEVDATQAGAGLSAAGAYLVDVATNYLATATSLSDADKKLDAKLKELFDLLNTELNNVETAVGLNPDGTKNTFNSVNVIDANASFKTAIEALDTYVGNLENGNGVIALQDELDATQVGAGLNANGGYTAPVASNYLGAATSLKGADVLLDTQLKTNSDNVAALTTEINNVEASVGLAVDGTKTDFASTSVITGNSTFKAAIEALDTTVGNLNSTIGSLQTEVDTIESSVGLNANGSKGNYSSVNYIANIDSHHTALGKLDSRAGTNASNIASLQTAVTAIEADIASLEQYDLNASTSLGLALDGGKVNFESSNVINPAGTFKAAIEALDAEIVNINGDIGARALQDELDATQVGAGLNADGSWTAPVGSNYLGASTTIKGALTALDTGLNTVANSLAGEITNRQNADAGLAQDILDEASARASADGGLQSELDATQVGAGLNVDGSWTPPNDTQFIATSVSIKNALDLLDQNLATVYNDFDIHHLHSNSYYVNDGVSDIQTVHDLEDFGAGDTIFVSSGSYGGATLSLTKQNFAIVCPDVPSGSPICELAEGRGITISGATCTRIRISNLQVEGNLTITGTEGRHLFKNVTFLGTVTITNTPNFLVFENCDFVGGISVSGTATVYFNRCNLNGAFITSTKASPLLTILTECAGLALTQTNLASNVAIVGRTGYVNSTVVMNSNSANYVYNLATGASTSFSGSYTELRNKPTIPTASTQLSDSATLVRTTDAGTVFPPLSAGVIPSQYLPSFVFAQVHLVADAAALANLPNIHTLTEGDVAIQQDSGVSWIWDGTQFQALGAAGSGIQEINTKSGVSVTLVTDDIAEDANPSNLWFTDARALSAAVTSSIDTDNKAPSTQTVKSYVSSNYVLLSDYEDSDVLTKIKNVDGTGSGLDADLLDGINSDGFVQTTGAQTVAGVKTFTSSPIVPTVAQLDGSQKVASTSYVDTAIANVGGNFSNSGALIYKGTFDASGVATPLANAKVGFFYAISAAGTLAGVNLNTTDQIIFVADVQGGTVVATDFIVVDNTESPVSTGNLPVVVFGGGQLTKGVYHLVKTNANITAAVPTKNMVSGKTGDVFYIRHRGTGTVTVTASGIAGGEFIWYPGDNLDPMATFGVKSITLTRAGEYKFVATQIDGAASSFVQWDVTVNNHKALRTTDDLTEGSTNLYHTTARARAALSATAPIVYNSTTGVISTTLTAYTDEAAQDAVDLMLTNGTHSGISYSYNDLTNALSSTVAITGSALTWPTVALNTGTTAGAVGNYYYTSTTLQGTAYTVTPPSPGKNGDILYIHNLGGNTVNFGTTSYYYNGVFSGAGATFTSTENDVFVFTRLGTTNTWLISKQVSHNRYAAEDAVDAVGAALVAGNASNTGIQFTYGATQDSANRIDATVSLAGFSTTNLAEGTNLYYTQERVEDAVNTLLTAGAPHTGISYSYTDNGTGAGALTSTVSLAGFSTTNLAEGTNLYHTQERVEDAVNTLLTAGAPHTGISYSYTDNGSGAGALTSTVSLAGFSINALSDVDTSTAAVNDVLTWNGTNWVGNAGGGGGGGSGYTYKHTHVTAATHTVDWTDPLSVKNEEIITVKSTGNCEITLPNATIHIGSNDFRGYKIIIKNLTAFQLTITSGGGNSEIWYDGAAEVASIVLPAGNIGFSTTLVLVKAGSLVGDYAWAVI